MTKYLINLVCIIGVAGAAHAGAVANLEITADGHAYLVFDAAGNGNLTGYTVQDASVATPVTFERGGSVLDGTGQYADAWSSLDSQGAFSGETAGLHDWFFEGTPPIPSFIGEGNIDGYLKRAGDAPVYIGRIIDTDAVGFGGALIADDFTIGRLKDVVFSTSDTSSTSGTPVDVGTVSLMVGSPLVTGSTSLLGTPYSETVPAGTGAPIPVGVSGTHIDATYTSGTGDAAVVDLEIDAAGITVGNVTTTVFGAADGHIMVNGTLLPIAFADLVQETDNGAIGAFVSGRLRLKAVDGLTTVIVDAILSENIPAGDDLGRSGDFGVSTLVISEVPGDFDLDGDCDADDIDMLTGDLLGATPAGELSLLYDVNNDGAVTIADRESVIANLVEWSNLDPNSGNGTAVGDINLDGKVTAGDYTLWAQFFGPGTTYGQGDLNGDGNNTAGDYTLWAQFFGTGPGEIPPAPLGAPVPTPEPATMALLAMGGLALLRRRRA